MDLISYVDSISILYGATEEPIPDTPAARALEKKALEFDLHLLQAKLKHLTKKNLHPQNIYGPEAQASSSGSIPPYRPSIPPIRAARPSAEVGSFCDWLIAAPGARRSVVSPTNARTWASPSSTNSGGHRRTGGAARPGL